MTRTSTRILITGGAGLVGSRLLRLLDPEAELHLLVRHPDPALEGLGNIHQHPTDLAVGVDVARLPARMDQVVHLAQSAHFRDFPRQAPDVFNVNVGTLATLLHYAVHAGATRFVLASSGGVYGSSAAPLREDTPVSLSGNPGFYLASKLCGELLAGAYGPHMDVVMLRLFFAYGRGQRRSMLLPHLVDSVRNGVPVGLAGPEGIRVNPIHADDAAAACRAALAVTGMRTINVAGPEVHSLRALCELIGARLGKAPVYDLRPGDSGGDVIGDTTRMTELLGPATRRVADHLDELL